MNHFFSFSAVFLSANDLIQLKQLDFDLNVETQ